VKYKDYYKIMGVDRNASADEIKKVYRKLARKYHPDVSKEKDAEEKFKEVSEAYETLHDPEKRALYDQLGSGYKAGQDFRPPPGWEQNFGGGHGFRFEDIDLSDLFSSFTSGGRQRSTRGGAKMAVPGQDYEVNAHISPEDAYHGTELTVNLNVTDFDERGAVLGRTKSVKARIPKGASDGQRLRLSGKGGKGMNGGADGNLYINISLKPHDLFRVSGHDLYIDLPLAPWEAVLGTTVQVPTLGGDVRLKVPAGTRAGQQLRVADRGLPKPHSGAGDLFAIVQIAVPTVVSDKERQLYQELSEITRFAPRAHFERR
jgi:curved DNA-binding protein